MLEVAAVPQILQKFQAQIRDHGPKAEHAVSPLYERPTSAGRERCNCRDSRVELEEQLKSGSRFQFALTRRRRSQSLFTQMEVESKRPADFSSASSSADKRAKILLPDEQLTTLSSYMRKNSKMMKPRVTTSCGRKYFRTFWCTSRWH